MMSFTTATSLWLDERHGAYLEVFDGLVAVAATAEILINVSEAVSPRLQLDQVGRLRLDR